MHRKMTKLLITFVQFLEFVYRLKLTACQFYIWMMLYCEHVDPKFDFFNWLKIKSENSTLPSASFSDIIIGIWIDGASEEGLKLRS